jgi:hypothetical protein
VLSAVLNDSLFSTAPTPFVLVRVTEGLESGVTTPTRDTNSYEVTSLTTGRTVSQTNVPLYSAPFQLVMLRLDSRDPDWSSDDEYVVTVSRIRDTRGNSIAPGSKVPVSRMATNTLVGATQTWRFHASASAEPAVADKNWFSNEFAESAWWESGPGPFQSPVAVPMCLGTPLTAFLHQTNPILFRTHFNWPTNADSSANVSIRWHADDGAVFFLNGQEFFRTNMAPRGWDLDSTSRALADRSWAICSTMSLTLTNLVPGTNLMAVGVYECHRFDGGMNFGFEMYQSNLVTRILPEEQSPILQVQRLAAGTVRLDWTGGGFALEAATVFSNNLSYPLGPWTQVTNMFNPYTNSEAVPFRLFRLKK